METIEIIERAFALGRECAEGWLEQAGTEGELPSEPTEVDLLWAFRELGVERAPELVSAIEVGFAERMSEVED